MCGDGWCYDATYGCVGKRDVFVERAAQEGACPDGQIQCGDGWCYDATYGCV